MKREGRGGVRLAVVAASPVRRDDLVTLFASEPSIASADAFPVSPVLERRLQELAPDVTLIDCASSPTSIFQLIRELAGHLRLVLLCEDPDPLWVAQVLRLGVIGVLHADASSDQIHAAIQAAGLGLMILDPDQANVLTERVPRTPDDRDFELEELTPRELEVLSMLADGFGNKEIAARLRVSEHTVKFHVSSILSKLGASSRTEAVTAGIRKGWVLL